MTRAQTVHQAKFSMGTVLGLIAKFGRAGVNEFERHFQDPDVARFRDCVSMEFDDEVDCAYPARWIGKVTLETRSGGNHFARVDIPKGDPGNLLSSTEVEDKALRLAAFRDGANEAEMRGVIRVAWGLTQIQRMGPLLAQSRGDRGPHAAKQ